jgi:electron transfer flavoprotein beta subunit
MKIVVAMKQIPDLQQIRIKNQQPVLDGVPYALGMIEKNALEAGIQLKETGEHSVVLASVGNEEVEETIKEALAVGADEAYMLLDESLENLESSQVAVLLAEIIRKIDDVGIILFGEGSGDNYSGQVGSRVAEILDMPQIGCASKIELSGQTAIVTRSLENADEILETNLPCVVTVLGDINEPRLPSVTQILKAGKKPKEIFELDDLDISLGDGLIQTISSLAPENERKGAQVKTVDDLISVLKTEGFLGR